MRTARVTNTGVGIDTHVVDVAMAGDAITCKSVGQTDTRALGSTSVSYTIIDTVIVVELVTTAALASVTVTAWTA